MSRIEIVPDEMACFEYYGKEYRVSPATDDIQRFVDSEYDYLRYLDEEEKAITLHWLGSTALNIVAGYGIPQTRRRKRMSQSEYDRYLLWTERQGLWQFEQDLEQLPDSDDIERYFRD